MASGAGSQIEEERDFDLFMRWSVDSLKIYLRKYGLSVSGTKKDLAAKSFAAWEMDLKPVPTNREVNLSRFTDYRSCLQIGDQTLPDPYKFKDDEWIGEKVGMKMWPPTIYFDICNFLGVKSLDKHLLRDYKEGKAYSYFESEWMKEIFYHPISPDNTVCFLKAQCCPSMNVRQEPHTIWVSIEKKSGAVCSAYCTCFAGLGQTCNHVAALLFRLDSAWKLGFTQPSCTSQECQWTKPANTSNLIQPQKVGDISWDKPKYSKTKKTTFKTSNSKRCLFSPQKSKKSGDITKLMKAMSVAAPDAVVHKVWSVENHDTSQLKNTNVSQIPLSVSAMSESVKDVKGLMDKMTPWQPEVVGFLERETVGQHTNDNWKIQREGRITSSNFHDVFTKVKTMETHPDTDNEKLLSRVLGYSSPDKDLKNLKYGRDMENQAKVEFKKMFKEIGHQCVKVYDVGLFVLDSHPYIGTSPDGVVECECCGLSCLEIKCPISVSHTIPKAGSPSYLVEEDGEIKLSQSHRYMTQIQGQLGITHMNECHLFVYSTHGHCLVKVAYDDKKWISVLMNLEIYFRNYVAPELLTRQLKLKLQHQSNNSVLSVVTDNRCVTTTMVDDMSGSCLKGQSNNENSVTSTRKCSGNQKKRRPTFVCPVCTLLCKEVFDTVSDSSVCCDVCDIWYHWLCVGVTSDVSDGVWICRGCQPS